MRWELGDMSASGSKISPVLSKIDSREVDELLKRVARVQLGHNDGRCTGRLICDD